MAPQDPFLLFDDWLAAALRDEPNDHNAMTLATVDSTGMPNARMVLLKHADSQGFVFYTNLHSAKGEEIFTSPKAALCFHWKSLRRQVRVQGPLAAVSDSDADAYFASRPRNSQIGAWASRQSAPMDSRMELEKNIAKTTLLYAGKTVPRPPHWSGFRLTPLRMEFWKDRPFRLHRRTLFSRDAPELPWKTQRLFP